MNVKYVPIQDLAKARGVRRSKIYYLILTGKLKEGTDWIEEKKTINRIVVREDIKV